MDKINSKELTDVVEFMIAVEDDYLQLIKKLDVEDEGKCHTFANLLASYLYVHFDKGFKHIRYYRHGWVSSSEYAFDFVEQISPNIMIKGDGEFEKALMYEIDGQQYNLLALDQASNIVNPYCLESFLNYVDVYYSEVDSLVVENDFYKSTFL
ncbi:hypothetical protein [Paenibacillus sp. FSL H3-0286]|uniref:hypothetical protein n=1 Tax=Paenibacillus sp. FSL H3-0286 TaxID=2921427 RepID=UPI0032488280